MKATEMGLITHCMRRPVNTCKNLRFRGYTFQKINFDYEFRLQGNFKGKLQILKLILCSSNYFKTEF